jgi:hypothetical protein
LLRANGRKWMEAGLAQPLRSGNLEVAQRESGRPRTFFYGAFFCPQDQKSTVIMQMGVTCGIARDALKCCGAQVAVALNHHELHQPEGKKQAVTGHRTPMIGGKSSVAE